MSSISSQYSLSTTAALALRLITGFYQAGLGEVEYEKREPCGSEP